MVKELRIYRTDPYDPLAQVLLVPPKAIEPPDLSDMTGPTSFFYLAERSGVPLGYIALRNEGSFGLIAGLHFRADEANGFLADILIEQVETQARSLRLPVLRVWVGDMHPNVRAALVRNGFFPDGEDRQIDSMRLYERPLHRGARGASANSSSR
jgi:hypothetical protein